MRRFTLERDEDVTGISGTGTVAEGVEFTDGTAVVRWVTGEHRSTVVWPGMASVEAIHGHGGATRIVWSDPEFVPTTAAYMPPGRSAEDMVNRGEAYYDRAGVLHDERTHEPIEARR